MAQKPINPAGGELVVDDWDLLCHFCHGWVPGVLLVEQTWRLARHLVVDHPYEAALLAVMLARERARADADG